MGGMLFSFRAVLCCFHWHLKRNALRKRKNTHVAGDCVGTVYGMCLLLFFLFGRKATHSTPCQSVYLLVFTCVIRLYEIFEY